MVVSFLLPPFCPSYFSFSAFFFFKHAAVLWLFCVSQDLHFNCVLGTVQAAAMCPFLPQARHALTPAAAPEALILRCLNSSDIREVLSILTMRLWTVSHVVFESIASWTFTRTLFSWIVFNRQMINTSSGVIEKPSQFLKSSTTVCVVADCDWP